MGCSRAHPRERRPQRECQRVTDREPPRPRGTLRGGRRGRRSRERTAQPRRLSSATWLLGEPVGSGTAWPQPLGSGRRMCRGVAGSLSRGAAPPPSPQDVGGEFRVAEADVTDRASGDDVPRAVGEDERSPLRCQDVRTLAGPKPADLPVEQPTKFGANDQPHDGQGAWTDDPAE